MIYNFLCLVIYDYSESAEFRPRAGVHSIYEINRLQGELTSRKNVSTVLVRKSGEVNNSVHLIFQIEVGFCWFEF